MAKTRPLIERFLTKVATGDGLEDCWAWTAGVNKDGYGRIHSGPAGSPVFLAHRAAYELFIGPVPDGLSLDHVCHTNEPNCAGGPACPHRRCVNPWHLEAVPRAENTMRGRAPTVLTYITDVCQRGHAFTENAYTHPKTGKRNCRECRRWRRQAGAAA